MMKVIYWIFSRWHLYRGVAYAYPVSRYHFERYEHYNQLRRGESPRIARTDLWRRRGGH